MRHRARVKSDPRREKCGRRTPRARRRSVCGSRRGNRLDHAVHACGHALRPNLLAACALLEARNVGGDASIDQSGFMWKIADASAELAAFQSGKGDAVEPDGSVPGPRFEDAGERAGERGLSAAGRSDDGEAIIAGLQLEAERHAGPGSAQLRTEIDSRSTARDLFGRGRDADGGHAARGRRAPRSAGDWHWRTTARLRQCAAAISTGTSARGEDDRGRRYRPCGHFAVDDEKGSGPQDLRCSAGRTALTAALSALARRAASVRACRCRRLSLVQRRCNPLSERHGRDHGRAARGARKRPSCARCPVRVRPAAAIAAHRRERKPEQEARGSRGENAE